MFNKEHFKEDMRSLFTADYRLDDGRTVKGVAASWALSCMRGQWGVSDVKSGRRWRGLGSLGDFEALCREEGFAVTYHGYNTRGNRAVVIHEKT